MHIGVWSFEPRLVTSVLAVLVLAVLLGLGFWQMDRAEKKNSLFEDSQERSEQPPVELNTNKELRGSLEGMLWRKVKVSGHFDPGKHFLLDNQVRQGNAGYYVYTPFQLENENLWALVNRGWIPLGNYRELVPVFTTSTELLTLDGVAKKATVTGILSEEGVVDELTKGIVRLQQVSLAHIGRDINAESLLPYIIRLSSSSSEEFSLDWNMPGSGVEKHLAYAFQWFLMTFVLFIIYVILNTRRRKAE